MFLWALPHDTALFLHRSIVFDYELLVFFRHLICKNYFRTSLKIHSSRQDLCLLLLVPINSEPLSINSPLEVYLYSILVVWIWGWLALALVSTTVRQVYYSFIRSLKTQKWPLRLCDTPSVDDTQALNPTSIPYHTHSSGWSPGSFSPAQICMAVAATHLPRHLSFTLFASQQILCFHDSSVSGFVTSSEYCRCSVGKVT